MPLILFRKEIDGPLGADMITSQAGGTVSLPLRVFVFQLDVMHWAYPDTFTASDTPVCCVEILVVNQKSFEQGQYQITLQAGHASGMQTECCSFGADLLFYPFQFGNGVFQFLFLNLRSVDVKSRQCNVRIGHQQRKTGMQTDSDCRQCPFKNLAGAAHIIPTSSHKITVMFLIIREMELTDKA